MPAETLILLPSKTPTPAPASHNVFLVHPIEGDVSALRTVAQDLKAPVYGLQCTAQAPLKSAEDLASYYIQVLSHTGLLIKNKILIENIDPGI